VPRYYFGYACAKNLDRGLATFRRNIKPLRRQIGGAQIAGSPKANFVWMAWAAQEAFNTQIPAL
jgi:hypothetical protein